MLDGENGKCSDSSDSCDDECLENSILQKIQEIERLEE
jgi:hypothetical protein